VPGSGPRNWSLKNQNREERVRCGDEVQCGGSFRYGADSVQTVEIELHCGAAALDNHSLKRAGPVLVKITTGRPAFWSGLFELGLGSRSRGGGGCVIS